MRHLFFFAIAFCWSCSTQQETNIKNDTVSSVSYSDTIRYESGKIKMLYNKKNNVNDGSFIQFGINGDTISLGYYLHGKKDSTWTYFLRPLSDYSIILSDIKNFPIDTVHLDLNSTITTIFKDDNLIYSSQKIYRAKTSKLMRDIECFYRKDTLFHDSYWLSDGSKRSSERLMTNSSFNDTSFYWYQNGKLEEISIYDHGKLIKKDRYDSTGSKIISDNE